MWRGKLLPDSNNKKKVQRAGNKREKSQKQLRPSHDNDEGRQPTDTDI